jgi:hypothetical protein
VAASVLYGVDMTVPMVWFEALTGDADYGRGVLCRRHADALVVPRGWSLDDRREPVPRLFRSPAQEVPPRPPRRRRRKAVTADDPLPIEPAPASLVDPTAPGGEPRPWEPVFDESDDLAGVLRPSTPMLARAFRSAPKREA